MKEVTITVDLTFRVLDQTTLEELKDAVLGGWSNVELRGALASEKDPYFTCRAERCLEIPSLRTFDSQKKEISELRGMIEQNQGESPEAKELEQKLTQELSNQHPDILALGALRRFVAFKQKVRK